MGRRQIQLLLWPRLPKGSLGQATLKKFGLDQACSSYDQQTKASRPVFRKWALNRFSAAGLPSRAVEAKATKAARLAAV